MQASRFAECGEIQRTGSGGCNQRSNKPPSRPSTMVAVSAGRIRNLGGGHFGAQILLVGLARIAHRHGSCLHVVGRLCGGIGLGAILLPKKHPVFVSCHRVFRDRLTGWLSLFSHQQFADLSYALAADFACALELECFTNVFGPINGDHVGSFPVARKAGGLARDQ